MPAALHAAVQVKLAESNNGTTGRARARVEPSLLAGKLFDEAGERLMPTHARKRERRYRYYVSTVDRQTDHGPLPLRWAEQIDQLVD